MKSLVYIVYTVMAVWLLVAAALRIELLLRAGNALDPLPFVSGAIGLMALLLVVPATAEWHDRRTERKRSARFGRMPAGAQDADGRRDQD